MIEVKNISKWFDGVQVLHDINARFETGKTNLIIGQSGSGKTVLLKCLVGLLKPEDGEIYYDGRCLNTMNAEQRKELRMDIGMLFQGSALFDNETVLGNVMFPLKMFSPLSHKEQLERAHFCIDRVGLKNADNKYPSEISGGMQKRVAIARAISLNPKYLFCDEPNSGLDPRTSLLIDDLLSDITHEYQMTTVINTHDMNSVLGIGEHIIFINKGHCDWSGNDKSIYRSDNQSLNDLVFASTLFKEVKRYMERNANK
ncbi:MAG: ATP-binding cassette domain-containing protein [Muribaculaceae bacterium]|nr:ATP-binding cassette domain-containing protein [Bacteroides sp.]MDE6194707.1 ATP-binding cassette domain-containing protein [Muribaculaceae bacterium]MDE6856544.1 ATP-binding cassette domain-containing protein [Muribaculaceae bacterium]